jgi:type II secretory pathway predicted ATPase ExeA
MDRPPFRPAVDPTVFFAAPTHVAALAALAAAFERREPAVLIDGPTGVGKSLVARKWLDDLLPEVPRVVLPNARAERPGDLLQAILFDMGKPYHGLTEQELRLAVTGHMLDAAESGYPTVMLIDEAQHLSLSALEEVRLLGNLETRSGAAAFAVLVAQPRLRAALTRTAYSLIADRIAVRASVEPLTAEDSIAFLNHQVRAVGGQPDAVFDAAALVLLAGASRGVPRTLNRAAGLACELAAEAEADQVDVEAVLEALGRIGVAPQEEAGTGDALVLAMPGDTPAELAKPPEPNERTATRRPKERTSRKRSA